MCTPRPAYGEADACTKAISIESDICLRNIRLRPDRCFCKPRPGHVKADVCPKAVSLGGGCRLAKTRFGLGFGFCTPRPGQCKADMCPKAASPGKDVGFETSCWARELFCTPRSEYEKAEACSKTISLERNIRLTKTDFDPIAVCAHLGRPTAKPMLAPKRYRSKAISV